MKARHAHRWLVTLALFCIAVVLYLIGFSASATVIVFVAFIVESIAWLSFLVHPPEKR